MGGRSWDDVLPYYKRSENYHRRDAYSSDEGELLVQEQWLKWDILETFKKACEDSGFTDRPDFNRGDNSGVGYFEVNQKTVFAFHQRARSLNPVMHRRNLNVITKTLTEQPVFDGDRCIGVDGVHRGKPISPISERIR